MANDSNEEKRKKRKKLIRIVGLLVICILLILGVHYGILNISYNEDEGLIIGLNEQQEETQSETEIELLSDDEEQSISDEVLYVHMIDVGQADSFLFIQGDKVALIDCGTTDTGKKVVQYLKDLGVTKIDYLIGTHPHDDHMGGMLSVILNFEIGEIIIPTIPNGLVTTAWYGKLMKKIADDNMTVVHPKEGDIFKLGAATMKVVGQLTPEEARNEKNNYSTVIKVTIGEMDILMTGDAETQVERKILLSGEDIECEILKVGHHGSDTSTSDAFLEAVNPEYGLISSKVGNRYDHPIKSTMDKLRENNVIVYRTDESGDVVIKITEKDITFYAEPGDYLSGTELNLKEEK